MKLTDLNFITEAIKIKRTEKEYQKLLDKYPGLKRYQTVKSYKNILKSKRDWYHKNKKKLEKQKLLQNLTTLEQKLLELNIQKNDIIENIKFEQIMKKVENKILHNHFYISQDSYKKLKNKTSLDADDIAYNLYDTIFPVSEFQEELKECKDGDGVMQSIMDFNHILNSDEIYQIINDDKIKCLKKSNKHKEMFNDEIEDSVSKVLEELSKTKINLENKLEQARLKLNKINTSK